MSFATAGAYGMGAAMFGPMFTDDSSTQLGLVGAGVGVGLTTGTASSFLPRAAISRASRFLGKNRRGLNWATKPMGRAVGWLGSRSHVAGALIGGALGYGAAASIPNHGLTVAGAGIGAILGSRSGGMRSVVGGGLTGGIGGYLLSRTMREGDATSTGALAGFSAASLARLAVPRLGPLSGLIGAVVGAGAGKAAQGYDSYRGEGAAPAQVRLGVGAAVLAQGAVVGGGALSYMAAKHYGVIGRGSRSSTSKLLSRAANVKNPLLTVLGGAMLAGGAIAIAGAMADTETRTYGKAMKGMDHNYLNSGGMSLAAHYKHNYGRAKT